MCAKKINLLFKLNPNLYYSSILIKVCNTFSGFLPFINVLKHNVMHWITKISAKALEKHYRVKKNKKNIGHRALNTQITVRVKLIHNNQFCNSTLSVLQLILLFSFIPKSCHLIVFFLLVKGFQSFQEQWASIFDLSGRILPVICRTFFTFPSTSPGCLLPPCLLS